jgi:hypothetical protein
MDHTQQHHEHHAKERQDEKKEWKEHIREISGKRRAIHPAWYVVLAAVMVGAATFVWTFLIW